MGQKVTIKNTSDLIAIFPELSNTNQFTKPVEKALQKGYYFDVQVGTLTTGFRSKSSGKLYYAKLSKDTLTVYIKRMVVQATRIGKSEEEYEKFKGRIISYDKESGSGKVVQITKTSWMEIAKAYGQLIKEDLIGTQKCDKCGGTGYIRVYSNIEGGLCFKCLGTGKIFEPSKAED